MSETIKRYTLIHRPGQTQPELVACEKSDYNAMCYSRDVSLIEAKCAELETKCAELLEAATNVVEWWGSGAEINLSAYTLIAYLRNAITKAKGEGV